MKGEAEQSKIQLAALWKDPEQICACASSAPTKGTSLSDTSAIDIAGIRPHSSWRGGLLGLVVTRTMVDMS